MYFDSEVYNTTAYKYCKRIADGKVPSNKWISYEEKLSDLYDFN